MKIRANGEILAVDDGTTVAMLIERLAGGDATGVAVAVNREVVPRSGWSDTAVHEGDEVEILMPLQGG